jgi:hypothetical protein
MIAAEIKLLQKTLQDTRSTSIRQSLLKRIYHLNRETELDAKQPPVARRRDQDHDGGR